jgi:CSLREA domain-containing protein
MFGRRRSVPSLVILAAAVLAPLAAAPPAQALNPAIVVNSAVDPGDGTCDVTECTLREAIAKANTDAGADSIAFGIPGAGVHTISVTSELPAITGQLLIDGYTQSTGTDHLIMISGTSAGDTADGLTVEAASSTIRGLAIGNFFQHGLVVTLADGVDVVGNLIGFQPNGSMATNHGDGILVDGGANDVIGGTTAIDRNVVGNSGLHGIQVQGGTTTGTLIQGNFIGTDLAGGNSGGSGNYGNGVFVVDAPSTTIGGTAPGAGNVISNNGLSETFGIGTNGIALSGSDMTGTVIQGNKIGIDVGGGIDMGNFGNGIFTDFSGVHDTTIGGTTAAARNVISGNDAGIVLFSAAGTVVQGNYVGVMVDGMTPVPNRVGVGVEGAGVLIGGTAPGAGNVISGNEQRGIDFQSNRGVIQGNLIGVGADGVTAAGNGGEGINDGGAAAVRIGGTQSGAGNVVAANGGDGIRVAGSVGTKILGNYIGTDATGTKSLGNQQNGINLDGASRSTVGGTTAAAANLVKHNSLVGILVHDSLGSGSSDRNRIRRDVFSGNGGLGIDLGGDGVTPNDAGDGDSGPNQLQNFPVIRSAVHHSSNTTLSVVLRSAPSTTYAIDVFRSATCDPSGNGEASVFLKSLSVTTNGAGVFDGTKSVGVVPVGNVITATATDPVGNTSELSRCRTVTAP